MGLVSRQEDSLFAHGRTLLRKDNGMALMPQSSATVLKCSKRDLT